MLGRQAIAAGCLFAVYLLSSCFAGEPDRTASQQELLDDDPGRAGKVLICHIPPGNPDNRHEIEISVNALRAHLNHGDVEGRCDEPQVSAIRGQVTTDQGAPLEGYLVEAQPLDGVGEAPAAFTTADGTYEITGIPAGDYRLLFFDFNGEATHLSEYYEDVNADDPAAATVLTVGPGTSLLINAALAEATISGRVLDQDGAPLQEILVEAQLVVGGVPTGAVEAAFTDADGNYATTRVPPGDYQVHFFDFGDLGAHVSEFYDNVGDPTLAAVLTVDVNSAPLLGIDAQLTEATIAGTVTDQDGVPLAGYLAEAEGSVPGAPLFADFTQTDGTYAITNVPPDTYRVRFVNFDDIDAYLVEYFDNVVDAALATPLTIGIDAGPHRGIDASVALASITGTVTSEAGVPLGGIVVEVELVDGTGDLTGVLTEADGTYAITLLPAGDYRMHFFDFSGTYREEYYDDATDPTAAETLFLNIDTAPLRGIDAALTLASGGE